jgi:hypothetical protein
MSHAFSIRRLRVSGCLAELIEKIQSRRASGVMSSHPPFASGAAARALRRSIGTLISGSSPARVISTVTVSSASAPAASCIALLTASRWLPLPFGLRAARNGKPLIVPSTIVIPRDGSFALALLGRVSRVHDPVFSVALGRNSLALKRIVDLVSCSVASFIYPHTTKQECLLGQLPIIRITGPVDDPHQGPEVWSRKLMARLGSEQRRGKRRVVECARRTEGDGVRLKRPETD